MQTIDLDQLANVSGGKARSNTGEPCFFYGFGLGLSPGCFSTPKKVERVSTTDTRGAIEGGQRK